LAAFIFVTRSPGVCGGRVENLEMRSIPVAICGIDTEKARREGSVCNLDLARVMRHVQLRSQKSATLAIDSFLSWR
jgi:hypothetical protein